MIWIEDGVGLCVSFDSVTSMENNVIELPSTPYDLANAEWENFLNAYSTVGELMEVNVGENFEVAFPLSEAEVDALILAITVAALVLAVFTGGSSTLIGSALRVLIATFAQIAFETAHNVNIHTGDLVVIAQMTQRGEPIWQVLSKVYNQRDIGGNS